MSEKIRPRDVYSAEEVNLRAAAGDVDLEGPEIPEGMVVKIEQFCAIDLTTANKTIRLGYKRGGNTFWITRQAPGTGLYGIGLNYPVFLVEGERPVARIESATASDECRLIARGSYLNAGPK